jgi:uncharacterized membrane protein YkoI
LKQRGFFQGARFLGDFPVPVIIPSWNGATSLASRGIDPSANQPTITMKTTPALIAFACATALASAQMERREVHLGECPQPVQATVNANARGGHIEEVDVIGIEGKTIYIAEIALSRHRDLKVYVSGNGALLKTLEEMFFREIPEPVRTAAQGIGGAVDDIEKETRGEAVTYHVEIDRPGETDLDVVLAADGAILSQTEEADD